MTHLRMSLPTKSVFLVLGGLVLLTLALPLAGLVGSARQDGWSQQLSDPRTLDALRLSLVTATVATAIIATFAVPLGYLLARGRLSVRAPIAGLTMLPMVLPGLAGGILLLQTYGPHGTIGEPLSGLGVTFTGTAAGVVLAQVYVACPLVIVASMVAFANVDPQLEAAAATLGDASWRTFRRVTLPLAWPSIAAGLALAWMRALGEFGATMILAYNPRTLPVHLWVSFESRGLTGALPVAFTLAALAACTVTVWIVLSGLRLSVHAPARSVRSRSGQ